MTTRFKYIIVGAGMMGAAAARHLSKRSDGVALIGPAEPGDLRTHRGVFASHYDEARITRTIDPDPVWARLANRSIARYGQIASDSGVDFYTETGCLIVAPRRTGGPSYVGDVLAAAGRLDVSTQTFDNQALAQEFPCFDFPEDSEGVFEARNAGFINPRKLVKAQTVLSKRQGCSLFRETVTSIREVGSQVMVMTEEGNVYHGDKVLVAAGGFTIREGILPRRIDLRAYARTVAFYEVDDRVTSGWGAMPSLIWKWSEDDEGIYLLPPVRYPDGKTYLKIGGDPDDLRLKRESDIRAWFRSGGREGTHGHLAAVFTRLMPKLGLRSTSMAACVTVFTPTGYPVISMAGSSRIGVLAGGCGAAAKSSDEIGRLGAELLIEGRVKDEAYTADFDARFLN